MLYKPILPGYKDKASHRRWSSLSQIFAMFERSWTPHPHELKPPRDKLLWEVFSVEALFVPLYAGHEVWIPSFSYEPGFLYQTKKTICIHAANGNIVDRAGSENNWLAQKSIHQRNEVEIPQGRFSEKARRDGNEKRESWQRISKERTGSTSGGVWEH